MRNQFFYTYEYQVAPAEGAKTKTEPITLKKMASFNIEKVIRTVEIENGQLIVILDDFHEEWKQIISHNANGKPIPKMEKQMLQSEIHLNIEDKERFRKMSEILNIDFNLFNNPTPIINSGV